MEISPSLFDLEESVNVSQERVDKQANDILERYDEMVQQFREAFTKGGNSPTERQQIIQRRE